MLWVPLDRTMDMPLYRQIYGYIRQQVLNGHLAAGEKLPSTRELAAGLEVSRNVVIEAYDQLRAEGFVESRQGSATCVVEGACLTGIGDVRPEAPVPEATCGEQKNIIDFRSGIPLFSSFPRRAWERAGRLDQAGDALFNYGRPEGLPALRNILTRYLVKTRGLDCRPEQIVVTSGATQAFTLIARLLLSPEADVVIEDPVSYEVPKIFSFSGCRIVPVPVDEHGMRTDLLPSDGKLVFVTPSHQFPIGGTLPIQRRIQLISFARASGCYIVEDDYDSEFCFDSKPINSLQGLEPERVIYVGTFSKILSPGLRLGYLVLPHALVERCRGFKWYADLHTSSLEQATLARFMEEGSLERYIARMKKVYQKNRLTLVQALERSFPGEVRILGNAAGLHLVAEFGKVMFTEQLVGKLLAAGVRVYPVEQHAIRKNGHLGQVILGYGNLSMEDIEKGVKRLQAALAKEGF